MQFTSRLKNTISEMLEDGGKHGHITHQSQTISATIDY